MSRYCVNGLVTSLVTLLPLAGCGDNKTNFEAKQQELVRIKLTVESDDNTGEVNSADSAATRGSNGKKAPLSEDTITTNSATNPGDEGIPDFDSGTSGDEGVPDFDGETPDDPESEAPVSNKERQACAKFIGVPIDRVKVTGNQTNVSLTSSSAIAIKVAGNQSNIELFMTGTSNLSIRGVCLFVTGNQGKAVISTDINLGGFLYIGRGNRSNGTLIVNKDAELEQSYVDLSGNQAMLKISGEGSFTCPTPRLKGHSANFECQ